MYPIRFKEVCFISSALVRAKRLLPSIMHANPVCSSESVVIACMQILHEGETEDNQEGVLVNKKKLNVSGIVLMRSFKRRSLHSCHRTQTKTSKNCAAM